MVYTCYKVKFKAEAPVFVGTTKIGLIQQTRRYIPGKTMWGAITANITRKLIDAGVMYSSDLYRDIGKCVEDCIRTTYFYPTINNDILFPNYTKDGLKYGSLLENEFESMFIKSFVSTATMGNSGAAMDESLHETEYISNRIKYGGKLPEQIYWTGYMFIEDCVNERYSMESSANNFEDIKIKHGKYSVKLSDALQQIYVGGDSRYGFGKLTLLSDNVSGYVFGCEIDEKLKFNLSKGTPLFAHMKIQDDDIKDYFGAIEPLVGRVYNRKGFGRCLESNGIAFIPGTCFTGNVFNIEIEPFGILNKNGSV